MSNRLAGKIAVVTGGASGIGLETTRRFLAEGARVVIGDYNVAASTAAVADLEAQGFRERVFSVKVDVADESDVETLMHEAASRFGGLDIVFNNAGIGGAIGSIVETDVRHWDETFAVLMRGVFLGTKHAARLMIARGGGVIVNTASIGGVSGGVLPTAYSAAKAAVLNFTQNAANELADHRIRVNAVAPGVIFTQLMHNGRSEEAADVVRQIQPWPDRGQPTDVADAVLFLCSDEARFITGTSLAVDGGYLANGLLRVHPLPGASARPTYAGITYGLTGKPREVRRLK